MGVITSNQNINSRGNRAPRGVGAVEGAEAFDPGSATVAQVIAYVAEFPGERDRVMGAEAAGRARKSLLEAL